MINHGNSLNSIVEIIDSNKDTEQKLNDICVFLNNTYPRFTWVGFYFMNHSTKKLHLGPYVGAPTDHTIIPFGKGICGQVAVSGSTYIADNVGEESNYIACSIDVKSEIVVPIYEGENLIAQLDIDSNVPSAFSEEDHQFLETVCQEIGNKLGSEMELPDFVATS